MNLQKSKDKGKCDMRAMYDLASHVTFITRYALDKVQHKVLKCHYTIKINGFNEFKIINSKIVEISWVLHNKTRKFQAVVIPEIKTKTSCPNISYIADVFSKNKLL